MVGSYIVGVGGAGEHCSCVPSLGLYDFGTGYCICCHLGPHFWLASEQATSEIHVNNQSHFG